jgi:hypothetical protein
MRTRFVIHATVGVVWLALSIFCLTRPGHSLASSLPFIAFDSNFAIVYSAAAALEALHAGNKTSGDTVGPAMDSTDYTRQPPTSGPTTTLVNPNPFPRVSTLPRTGDSFLPFTGAALLILLAGTFTVISLRFRRRAAR